MARPGWGAAGSRPAADGGGPPRARGPGRTPHTRTHTHTHSHSAHGAQDGPGRDPPVGTHSHKHTQTHRQANRRCAPSCPLMQIGYTRVRGTHGRAHPQPTHTHTNRDSHPPRRGEHTNPHLHCELAHSPPRERVQWRPPGAHQAAAAAAGSAARVRRRPVPRWSCTQGLPGSCGGGQASRRPGPACAARGGGGGVPHPTSALRAYALQTSDCRLQTEEGAGWNA